MCTEKKTPHVHAELIKAWADGAKIQYKFKTEDVECYRDCDPKWSTSCDYRVKPTPKVKKYLFAFQDVESNYPSITVSYYENYQAFLFAYRKNKFKWVQCVDASVIEV